MVNQALAPTTSKSGTQPRSHRLLCEALLALGIWLAALWLFGSAAQRSEFFGDESHYISSARYFGYLFLQHDVTRKEWGDNFATHTQPMLTNYLVGAWLWARGYDVDDLLREYDWRRTLEENRAQGRVPDPALLADARQPIVALAAGTILGLYALARSLGGLASGLVAASLAAASPLVQDFVVRVAPEAPFTLLMLVGLLCCVLGARAGRDSRLPLRWAVAVGILLGLALGTKLTAAFSLAALVAWGALAAALSARRPLDAPGTPLARAWKAGQGWALATCLAVAVFVISDPHLYRNPLLHTLHLVQDPIADMLEQQRYRPAEAVFSPLDRPRLVLGGSLVSGTFSGSLGFPIEAFLVPLGVALLARPIWIEWRANAQLAIEGLVLLTVLAYFAGISAGLMVNYPRYFLPTLLLGTLFSSRALTAIVRRFLFVITLLKRRSRVIQPAAPGP